MLAALVEDQEALEDDSEQSVAKIKLSSSTLDGQAEELFRSIAASTQHSSDDAFAVHDAVRAHRSGNSGPIAAMIEKYGEVQPESEAAE